MYAYIHLYTYMYTFICLYICIYIYIERERKRERCLYVYTYMCIYKWFRCFYMHQRDGEEVDGGGHGPAGQQGAEEQGPGLLGCEIHTHAHAQDSL